MPHPEKWLTGQKASRCCWRVKHEEASLTRQNPAPAIKDKSVTFKLKKHSRPLGFKVIKLSTLINVRCLYQPGRQAGLNE